MAPDRELRVASAVSYLLLPAVAFLFLSRYRANGFVRGHAMQAILLTAAAIVLALFAYVLLSLSAMIGLMLGTIFAIAVVLCWAVLVIKALQGEPAFYREIPMLVRGERSPHV